MSDDHERPRRVDDAIFSDEIGLEYGIYGHYRLKSSYQPIFAPQNGYLVPTAVEALVQPHILSQPVAVNDFFADVAPQDRLLVEAVCWSLHLRNYKHIDAEGLSLFINYDPRVNDHQGRALAEIRKLARDLGDYRLVPDRLVYEITETAAPDEDVLVATVAEMRRHGFRIAVDDFGAGYSTEARLGLIEPDIVKIDGAWFAELCRHRAAESLFRPLLALLHDRGIKVLVEGIERPVHLHVALEAGADMVQGFLLARPALAGTIFNAEPLPVGNFLSGGARVIPLFG